MKRAIIFLNGDLSDRETMLRFIKPTDTIICVDGGANYAYILGIKPDVIIGDFDSILPHLLTEYTKQKINMIQFSHEKDETDSELAIDYAREQGFNSIVLCGVLGSRIDHFLGNILSLGRLFQKHSDLIILEGKQEIRAIKNSITLTGTKGDLVSLIPLTGIAKQVTTKNLQYPLQDEDLLFGYSRGISNVMLTSNSEITMSEGILLVIHTKI